MEGGEEEHFQNVDIDGEDVDKDVDNRRGAENGVGKANSVTSLNSTQSDAASSIFGVDSDDDNDNDDARWKSVNRYGFTGRVYSVVNPINIYIESTRVNGVYLTLIKTLLIPIWPSQSKNIE